ncbi:MAG TPA: ABC transporter family substrate-binding protein [Mycobacteriales bacterium]|nr:ABC transporter family substrate-binding protein [Mycobacteriales bacterium]
MRVSRKGVTALAVAAIGSIALSACAGSSNNSSGGSGGGGGGTKSGGSVIYGADQFPDNFQPDINAGNSTATANADVRVLPSAFLTLPNFQPQYDKELLTAEPTVTSKSPYTVQYKINPKAVWSDGKPIDAKDFIFAWKANNPTDKDYGGTGSKLGANACQTLGGNPYNYITSVTGSDNDKTVTAVFSKPYADWKQFFSTLLPSHLFVKSTPAATCKAFNTGWPSTKVPPISGGPWTISSVDANQKLITETRNEKYWGKKPILSKLIFKVVSTGSQDLQQALQNNEVQVIYPQPQLDLVKLIDGVTSAKAETNFGLSFEHIDFNTENQFLKDPVLRKAIALSIDRADLVKRTVKQFDNRAQVLGNRLFVNNQQGYANNAPADYDKLNVGKAKSMLQAAGYKLSGGKLTKGGKAVSLNIVTTTNNQLRQQTEEVVANDVKAIGIKLDIKQVDANTFFGDYKTQGSLNAGDCDLCLFAWVATPYLSSNFSIYQCVPDGPDGKPDRSQELQNAGLGCDKKVDTLMQQAQFAPDEATAQGLWNQVDKDLWGDMFTLPLYQKPTYIAFNKKYQGIGDNATSQGPLWNSETWALKQ